MIVNASQWQRPMADSQSAIFSRVSEMLETIQADGNMAIEQFSEQFDGFKPEVIPLPEKGNYGIKKDLLQAIEQAAERIQTFAEFQKKSYQSSTFSDAFGTYGQTVVPVETMAGYIPGGRFPLLSTALMTLIPAKVAGCKQRIAVSPSDNPAILAAASIAGATRFIRIGGVQAIAALAYGSNLSEPVDMIVGPGNAYVNAAKALLQSSIKIDSLAGPSELLVIADDTSPADWIAKDLLGQTEHDPMALSVVCCWHEPKLREIEKHLAKDPAGAESMKKGSCQLVLCDTPDEAIGFANRMAPEHLSVMSASIAIHKLEQYGALFCGPYSAVAYGDYCSGPNHTLPTLGNARQKGGLSVGDFFKVLSYQSINEAGNKALAAIAIPLAEAEGLVRHKASMACRQQS